MDSPSTPLTLAPPPPERTTIRCTDPATGELLGEVPVMDRAEVQARLERARAAQLAWRETSFAQRRRVVRRILDHVLEHSDELCRMIARDAGKTLENAAVELWPVCEAMRWNLAHAEKALRPQKVSSGLLVHKSARVEYHPLGVIGVICPWNFPLQNVLAPAIPAIMAGNAALVKVSEWTSWSAARIQQIFDEALRAEGHSVDLVQLLTGYGPTGAALVTSGVDKIVFTGSIGNGKRVLQASVDNLTPVILELGGKDPMIVCDDAVIEQAASTALFGVFNACGQMCVGAERLFVFAAVYDEFVARVLTAAQALRQGPPLGPEVDLGAMTMARQLEIIQALVDDAVAKGARVLCGGQPRRELGTNFYPPTILVDVDRSMRIMHEEHFGPVMVITRVASEAEAIAGANDCPYGLGSSVFTRDPVRAQRMARAIQAGMTTVNDFGLAYMIQSLPFGGLKISGFGKINGREGLRACCNEKAIVTDRIPVRQGMALYPIRAATLPLVMGAVQTIYGAGVRERARGALRVLGSLIKLRRQRAQDS